LRRLFRTEVCCDTRSRGELASRFGTGSRLSRVPGTTPSFNGYAGSGCLCHVVWSARIFGHRAMGARVAGCLVVSAGIHAPAEGSCLSRVVGRSVGGGYEVAVGSWVQAFLGESLPASELRPIAMDGKTLRGRLTARERDVHLPSLFDQRLGWGGGLQGLGRRSEWFCPRCSPLVASFLRRSTLIPSPLLARPPPPS
jgi:hypothetical protein